MISRNDDQDTAEYTNDIDLGGNVDWNELASLLSELTNNYSSDADSDLDKSASDEEVEDAFAVLARITEQFKNRFSQWQQQHAALDESSDTLTEKLELDESSDTLTETSEPDATSQNMPEPEFDYINAKQFERDQARYRDAHNKAKMASKQHRLEKAEALSQGEKPSHHATQQTFFHRPSRNHARYRAVEDELKLGTESFNQRRK